ncbi:MAG: bifunctional 5,10-methylenetetrahydrofolate dehydrogenase/5,10-methenyltetrahydrofolate cyclohydrolase [Candidatus Altarchaeaceae archaeon]
MDNIIDGKQTSLEIEEDVKKEVKILKEKFNKEINLATILVGKNPASEIYVNLKRKACERVGIKSKILKFEENIKEEELINEILKLNNDPEINGILVQFPLPKHINPINIMKTISPKKDVDCFNPENIGNLMIGDEKIAPCTPKGIIYLLEKYIKKINEKGIDIKIQGANVTIINHSNVIGKPLSLMLLNRNATVNVCHIFTKNLKENTLKADILITATGVPNLIKEDMIKNEAIVIDAGISKVNGKILGDVDFENVKKKALLITPVPGGVGPMTIAMLLKNTIECFKLQNFQ